MTKDTRIIHSLDKGLHLLEIIEEAGQPISLTEVWQKVRWDKATIHRLLLTLQRRGYLLRDPANKTYTLGLKIYGLYDSLKRNLDIQQIAKPHLGALMRRTGETAHLAVVVEKSVVFIDRENGSGVLSVNTQIGAREPLYCTALGRAYLAYDDGASLRELYPRPLEHYTNRTVRTVKELAQALKRVRTLGYAVDDEEYVDGIRCIAAPILNESGVPIAVIGISGPKHRLSAEKIRGYGIFIRETAEKISLRCGYVSPEGRGKSP